MDRTEEEQFQLDCRRPTLATIYAMTWALHDMDAEMQAGGLPVPILLEIEADCTADYLDQLQRDLGCTRKSWLASPQLGRIHDAISTVYSLDFCSGIYWED